MFLNDFLEKYGNIQNYKNPLLNPYSQPLNQTIYNKEEFHSLKLNKIEEKPIEGSGELMNHQKIIARYLSSHTMYDRLLLVHEPGTGKSCSAIGAVEQIKSENSHIKGALFLVKGPALIDNLVKELLFTCTKGQYIPPNFENLTELEKTHRINKIIREFYTFKTFETFATEISKSSDKTIIENYSNLIIIIDEAHNLRIQPGEKDSKQVYNAFNRFLHLVENCKVVLMSGTPMKDQPAEIASIMNLLLPSENQLPTDKEFVEEYLEVKDDAYFIKENKVNTLKTYLKGRISYLRAMSDDNIIKNFIGQKIGGLKHFKVDIDNMGKFQSESYEKAYQKDATEDTGVYNDSRQASLFVYPDGSYGSIGFKKYIQEKIVIKKLKDKEIKVSEFSLKKELLDELRGNNIEEKLEKLKKFSSKYHKCITEILNSENQSSFVYCEFVEGSGLIVFSKILELFGFSSSKGIESSEKQRYAILTTKTVTSTSLKNILKKFNSYENRHGKIIKVILGSKIIGEGFSLKNIQNVHIITPHWNYSETDQAIARGFRLFSHKDLGKKVVVNVYQHCSLNDTKTPSIDLKMYKTSEDKDISIHQIERILKEVAFDCPLNYVRNLKQNTGERECNYMDCEYKCDGFREEDYQSDLLTYNLFYSDEKINEIIINLKKYFKHRFSYSFNELKNLLKGYTEFQILSSLFRCITEKIIFINPYGFGSYISENNNQYYLNDSITYLSTFTDVFYDQYPILKEDDYIEKIEDLYYESIPKKIEDMKNFKDRREEILKKIPLEIIEFIIEGAILSNHLKKKDSKEFVEWILNFYKEFIMKIDNYFISSFLYNTQDKLRCFSLSSSIWSDCTSDLEKKYRDKLSSLEGQLEENEYGYYAIIEKSTDKFLIRDVSTGEKVEIQDARKKSKGKVCSTWKREDLLKIINSIKLEVLDKDFCKKYKDELLSLIETRTYKNAKLAYTIEELKKMSKEDLCRIVYWSGEKKEITCELLKKWFINKKLVKYE